MIDCNNDMQDSTKALIRNPIKYILLVKFLIHILTVMNPMHILADVILFRGGRVTYKNPHKYLEF